MKYFPSEFANGVIRPLHTRALVSLILYIMRVFSLPSNVNQELTYSYIKDKTGPNPMREVGCLVLSSRKKKYSCIHVKSLMEMLE